MFFRTNLELVLLVACFSAPTAEGFSQSQSPLPSSHNSNGASGAESRQVLGGSIGIRPELSKDSYAHTSAVGCSFGSVDIKVSSEEKGLGAFATCAIPFGTLLGHYNGESLDLKQVQSRYWLKGEVAQTEDDIAWELSRSCRGQGTTGHFLFQLPNGTFVDAEDADKSSWVRFMNHADEDSPHCNVRAFMKTDMADEDEEFPLMIAISDISAVRGLVCYVAQDADWAMVVVVVAVVFIPQLLTHSLNNFVSFDFRVTNCAGTMEKSSFTETRGD